MEYSSFVKGYPHHYSLPEKNNDEEKSFLEEEYLALKSRPKANSKPPHPHLQENSLAMKKV